MPRHPNVSFRPRRLDLADEMLDLDDEKWVEQLTHQLFGDKDPDSISMQELQAVMLKMQAMEPDVTHWTFGNMQRQADGTFKDEELAAILMTA